MKLMSGRVAAFAITFLTPVLLVRLFSQAEFGTYKQFMLITFTPYLIGCAFSECLFYFLPKDPERAGQYALNAMLMLFATGVVCLAAMLMFPARIAALVNNPALIPFVPLMGLYLLFTLMSTVLEITMISRKQYNLAAFTYVVSDLLRAAFLVVPALVTRRLHAALIGSVVFFALRVCVAFVYLRWEFPDGVRFDTPALREQWSYVLPYSLAGIVQVIQQNYHQYAVAFHFDPKTFAIYSVGCLNIPLVDFMATPTSNVMMVRMAERLRDGEVRELLPIWHDTTRKLALLFFPFVALLLVSAYPLITLLFTADFAASVPIFMVWCLSILLATFQTDSVLRVFAEIRYMFLTNVTRLTMLLLLMSWFLTTFDLMGPVLITLAGILLSKIMALARIRKVLQTTCAELLPWKNLAGTLIVAMAAAIPAAIVSAKLAVPSLVLLPLLGTVYVVCYASLVLAFRLLSRDEIDAIKATLCVWNRGAIAAARGAGTGR